MTETQFENEICKLSAALNMMCADNSVACVIPACMNVVLTAIRSVNAEDTDAARKVVSSLRPMIDYIESQLTPVH